MDEEGEEEEGEEVRLRRGTRRGDELAEEAEEDEVEKVMVGYVICISIPCVHCNTLQVERSEGSLAASHAPEQTLAPLL